MFVGAVHGRRPSIMIRHPALSAADLHGAAIRHWRRSRGASWSALAGRASPGSRRLSAIRGAARPAWRRCTRGRERRVEGEYPPRSQPLVDDLNALLDASRATRARGRVAKAGDLAHGLKTPLAVLAQEAERAARRRARRARPARRSREQVERMRRQIDYHLAQARAAAVGRHARRAMPSRESADGARAHAAAPARRRVAVRSTSTCRPDARRPRPARRSRRDARQPPRQRVQVGANQVSR